MSVRFALKAATDAAHERLDLALAAFDLGDADDYRRFLAIHAAVVPALEEQLIAGGLSVLIPDWPNHRRSEALEADVTAIAATRPEPIAVPAPCGPAQLLGAAYVLEGSRLGGQVLAVQVADRFPKAYLDASRDLAPWRSVVAALEHHLSENDDAFEDAKVSALGTFAAFMRSASTNGKA